MDNDDEQNDDTELDWDDDPFPDYDNDSERTLPSEPIRCKTTCTYLCQIQFSAELMESIKQKFYRQSKDNRRKWLGTHCRRIEKDNLKYAKYGFTLPDGAKGHRDVCRAFFLSVLGIKSCTDGVVRDAAKRAANGMSFESQQGKFKRNRSWTEPIKQHIEEYIARHRQITEDQTPNDSCTPGYIKTNKLFVAKMYRDYKQAVEDRGEEPVLIGRYTKVYREVCPKSGRKGKNHSFESEGSPSGTFNDDMSDSSW